MDILVRLGEAFARLREERLRLGEPVTCGGLCSLPVLGWFRGPVCDYLWLALGPLYDLFESVIS